MASVQGDSGVTDFGMISSRPGFPVFLFPLRSYVL